MLTFCIRGIMFNSIHKFSYAFLLSSAFLIENPAQAGIDDDNATLKVVAKKVVTDADLPQGLKQARNKLYRTLRDDLPKKGGVPRANITDVLLASIFDLSKGDEGINIALASLLNGASKRDNAIEIISAARRRYYDWVALLVPKKVTIGKAKFDLSPASLGVRAASLAKLEELNAKSSSSGASSSTSAKNPAPSLKAEEEAAQKIAEAKRKADEETARLEAEAKLKAEEEETARLEAEAKLKVEEEAARLEAEAKLKAEEETARLEAEAAKKVAAQNAVKRVTHLPKGYTADNFSVEETADGYILTAPTTGAGRFWLHQNPTNGATKNGHLVQPWALKKGQTLRVSFEVSDLQKRVELALVHTAFKQSAILPITKDGSYTMTFVAPEDMEVTPDIVAKTNLPAFKVSNIKVEIEDAPVIENKRYFADGLTVEEVDGSLSVIAGSTGASRLWLFDREISTATEKGHLIQPIDLKEGETLAVNLTIENLSGNAELALVAKAFKQLGMKPITKNGTYTLTYTAPQGGMQLTPDLVIKKSSTTFVVKDITISVK